MENSMILFFLFLSFLVFFSIWVVVLCCFLEVDIVMCSGISKYNFNLVILNL